MSTAATPRIAWIGLGNMGRAMTTNIVHKSTDFAPPLSLYNRTISRATELSATLPEGKTFVAQSVEDAVAEADIIFVIVGNDAASLNTASTASNVPNGGLKGKLYVECSTVAAETTTKLAAIVTRSGGDFVAMPVFGAVSAAIAGHLVCAPAGPKACVDRLRPFLEGVIARSIIDLSDEPYEKAVQLKILGNSFLLGMVQSLSEGHVVAEKCGLGSENLHKFITSVFARDGGPYELYSRRMLDGDWYRQKEPLFDISLAHKDATHMMDLARANGSRMLNVETADAQFEKVQKHAVDAGIKGDIIHTYGIARLESGLPFLRTRM